jgi:hypothetical protein
MRRSQRELVLHSLFASTGNSEPSPSRHHMTEVEFLELAVRWFLAIQRDREEHGPMPQRLVNGPLAS